MVSENFIRKRIYEDIFGKYRMNYLKEVDFYIDILILVVLFFGNDFSKVDVHW